MLITAKLLQKYNGIIQEEDNPEAIELVNIHIGTAQSIISNYVGFDSNEVLTDEIYPEDVRALFKNVCLRIATLLQLEDNGNIGVASSSDVGINRTFANIVDYTPYLKPLSAFRKIKGV